MTPAAPDRATRQHLVSREKRDGRIMIIGEQEIKKCTGLEGEKQERPLSSGVVVHARQQYRVKSSARGVQIRVVVESCPYG